jgi:uncharacterized membrane protein YqgA involved in biofilm formation
MRPIMLGTIVNCVAIIAGSLVGILFSSKISDEVSDVISSAAGVVTLIIGMQMAFQTVNVIYLALSLIAGGLLGAWWDIDGKILALGRLLEHRFGGSRKTGAAVPVAAPGDDLQAPPSRFAYAFLNASVLFCVGAMAIVGSFKAGTEGDCTILFTKSVLDGFMSIVFGAAMGIGTAFSALSILVYQGLLTLGSGLIKPFVTERMIAELTGVGGAFIVMIGINLLNLRKLKTANYLPALVIVVLFVLSDPVWTRIAAFFV